MDNAQLSAIATSLETKAGASTVANDGRAGYWKRVAAAAELLSGTSFAAANATVEGYMLRTAMALETLAGTSGAEETDGYTGFLKRITDALEVKAGAVGITDMDSRLVVAAANALFGLNSLFNQTTPEAGVWYDTSDITTMYQDSLGTTPAVVGQPVGLLLDKRLGLVRGAELVSNGSFNTDIAGWSGDVNTSLSAVGGKLRATLSGGTNFRAGQAISGLVIGNSYEVTLNYDKGTLSGAMQVRLSSTLTGASNVTVGDQTYNSSNSSVRFIFTAAATTHWLVVIGISTTVGQYFDLDDVSIKLFPGNHATQATTSAKPVLRQETFTNLVLGSQTLTDANWLNNNTTVAADAIAAPDGSLTADNVSNTPSVNSYIRSSLPTLAASTTYTKSIFAKAVTGTGLLYFEVNDGAGGASCSFNLLAGTVSQTSYGTATITPVGNGWYRCSHTMTTQATGTPSSAVYYIGGYGSTPTPTTIALWQAQIVQGAMPGPTILTTTAPVTYSVPGQYYLEFDGVDDYLRSTFTIAQPFDRVSAVQQISWTSGDAIFHGVSVIAGALYQNGASPQLSTYDGLSATNNTGLAIGVNGIATERHSGASSRLAINSGAYVTGDSGSTAPGGITIGANNASPTASGASNIRFYGTVMIGRALTDAEITQARTYLASKSGVVL